MIDGINSSKKCFFAWVIVFVVLCTGLCVLWTVLNNNSPVEEQAPAEIMNWFYIGSFLFACLPIGWKTRKKIFSWYAHIPTEEIKVTETNLVVAVIRLGKCFILLTLDVVLFAFYTAVSVIIGPFINLYTIITGIVFMVQKKI